MPIPMMEVPEGTRVYDSGPDYFDRFTVVFPDRAIYTMSTNALSEVGRFHFEGMMERVPFDINARQVHEVPLHVAEKIRELMV